MRPKIASNHKKLDWGYINQLKYPSKKAEAKGLCSYVKEKKCLVCKTKTIKFNRCKSCYYKMKGWTLQDKGKREPMVTPDVRMKEPEKMIMLTDSTSSIRSIPPQSWDALKH